ncbi:DUF6000 family protein [Streptomyces sp. NBC_00386]|uniref:DUF6000 family protein n=1 Tax=Streptomyces sp. NBC_00386 TaxID=2975734 RepID=UPI002E22ED25
MRHDQHAGLGALLRLDARLGTHHADRFTRPDGLWGQWVDALAHLRGDPDDTLAELRRWTDLRCDFANGWTLGREDSAPRPEQPGSREPRSVAWHQIVCN